MTSKCEPLFQILGDFPPGKVETKNPTRGAGGTSGRSNASVTGKAVRFDKTSAGDGISAAMFQSAVLFIWAEQPIDISLQKEYREERLTHSEGAMKSIKTLAVVTAAITLSACVSNPNTAVFTTTVGVAGRSAGRLFG